MRIVGGSAKGTRLAVPKSDVTRPTSDRVRETVFNILEHGIADFELKESRVLDLFAGTGALGLEALSRGAGAAVFIDDDAGARGLIRENAERTHLLGRCRISRRDGANLGPLGKGESFNLIFVDPPYGRGLALAAIERAQEGGWFTQKAILVVEDVKTAPFSWPEGVSGFDERNFGKTTVYFGQCED